MPACSGVIHVRRARPGDAAGIATVHVRTWQHAYQQLLPPDFLAALNIAARERFWRAELELLPADRMPWLAESGGGVAGFVSAGPSRDAGAPSTIGEVYAIYVLPDCWDRGVGADLLRHAEGDLVEHGYIEATLWVLSANDRARRFYERAGWRLDGERIERVGEIEMEEVRYRRTLERTRLS
jgi:ribosomal protein S18 acetylase RimI-like enzyme